MNPGGSTISILPRRAFPGQEKTGEKMKKEKKKVICKDHFGHPLDFFDGDLSVFFGFRCDRLRDLWKMMIDYISSEDDADLESMEDIALQVFKNIEEDFDRFRYLMEEKIGGTIYVYDANPNSRQSYIRMREVLGLKIKRGGKEGRISAHGEVRTEALQSDPRVWVHRLNPPWPYPPGQEEKEEPEGGSITN